MATRILVVDDELLMRVEIVHLLENATDYHVCGSAEDGEEALSLIGKSKPDIILLDLTMPVMDGITMLKKLKDMAHPPKVLVLSCHDEFNLVKEALINGADDYILKNTLNHDNLINSLNKLRSKIQTDNKNLNLENISGDLKKISTIYHEDILKHIINGTIDKNVKLSQYISIDEKNCCCIVFAISHFSDVIRRYQNNDISFLVSSMCTIFENALSDIPAKELFRNKENEFILLLSFSNIDESRKIQDMISEKIEKLSELGKTYLNISIIFGIGSPFHSLSSLDESYRQAINAMIVYFYNPKEEIIFYKDKCYDFCTQEQYNNIANQLFLYCDINGYKSLRNYLSDIPDLCLKYKKLPLLFPEQIKSLYIGIARSIHTNNQTVDKLTIEKINSCETFEALNKLFDSEIFYSFQLDKIEQIDYLSKQTIQFINKNYV
jgi:two-component system response regulator YesN